MRVVILTQWYPPEPALLLQELAQSLQEFGHDVTVLTGFPNYPTGKIYPGYRLQLWKREVIAGVQLVRVPLFPEHSKSGIGRVLNYVSFALSAALLGAWLVRRPDVIFVYHPPLTVGIPAIILSQVWRVPFVYQIQDMWPETLAATGMLKNSVVLQVVGVFAKWIYNKARLILVISNGFEENLRRKGVPSEKIEVISNWVDTNIYFPMSPDIKRSKTLGLHDHFNIMFAGNMGEAQGLETVLEAATLLREMKNIQFVFVGDGVALPRLSALAKERNLDNVRFLGRFSPNDMPSLYALADVLLLHLKDNELFRITIPHKTFAYMASGKPVLSAITGDGARVITDVNAGIACQPENAKSLADSVCNLANIPGDELKQMGMNGLRAIQNYYTRQVLTKEIEKVLMNVSHQ